MLRGCRATQQAGLAKTYLWSKSGTRTSAQNGLKRRVDVNQVEYFPALVSCKTKLNKRELNREKVTRANVTNCLTKFENLFPLLAKGNYF